jgi:hypothetical protein
MRKTIAFVLLIIFTIGCQTSKTEKVEVNQPKIEATTTPTPKVEIPALTKEQKKNLDGWLPLEARKILENADEFEILGGTGSSFWTANKRIMISDRTQMKTLLDSLYYDISEKAEPADCFKPRHGLIAKHQNRQVKLIICYECSSFRGNESDVKNVGGLISDKFSKKVFDQILEKAEEVK